MIGGTTAPHCGITLYLYHNVPAKVTWPWGHQGQNMNNQLLGIRP